MTTIVLCSGGLDSVTLAYDLAQTEPRLHLLAVDYGQRHRRELACAEGCADALGAAFTRLDLPGFAVLAPGNALTDPATPLPAGRWDDPVQAATVVPQRNAVLLALAVTLAASVGAETVAFAAHAGDAAIYPDCRPAFFAAFSAMTAQALGDTAAVALSTPFLGHDKAAIVQTGAALGVPFGATWSCYAGGAAHCGVCGACRERLAAFRAAGVPDPIAYAVRRTAYPGCDTVRLALPGLHLEYRRGTGRVLWGVDGTHRRDLPALRRLLDAVDEEA